MKIISKLLISLGIISILVALSLIVKDYYNEVNAGKSASNVLSSIEETQSSEVALKEDVIEVNGNNYVGNIVIPSINLNLPINETYNYNKLKKAPCLYYGKINVKNFVICAHNYKKHFGNLINLKAGDSVIVTDAKGNSVYYKVEIVEEIGAKDIDEMLNSDFDLTLFTCTPGGKNRVTVRCNKVEI